MYSKLKKRLRHMIPSKNRNYKICKMYQKAHNAYLHKKIHLAEYYTYKLYSKYFCDISHAACIGENLELPHPVGIVIGAGAKIGDNVTIYQNVTLGRREKDIDAYPSVEDNVTIYCNAVLLGNITVGNGAVIGCGAIVLRDVRPGEVVKGIVK